VTETKGIHYGCDANGSRTVTALFYPASEDVRIDSAAVMEIGDRIVVLLNLLELQWEAKSLNRANVPNHT